MKTKTAPDTDGLAWLRTIRRDLQREIGATPQQRAAYYQAKDQRLRTRLHPGRSVAQTQP